MSKTELVGNKTQEEIEKLLEQGKKLAGYSLFGDIKISVQQTTITHPLVFLSFKATGMWVYGLSRQSQLHIKELLAGKTKGQALKLLADMPGIERSSINWGDDTRLPKNSDSIHFVMLIIAV